MDIEVTRTYLQLARPEDLSPARANDARVRIDRVAECPASFGRYLYGEVGRLYHWIDRLSWTDDQIRAHYARPEITMWVMTVAAEQAWSVGANRVWLHTCTLDDAAAMPNYLRRGFKPFKAERYFTTLAEAEQRLGRWNKPV